MILSDLAILEAIGHSLIKLEPFRRECLGSHSYDVHLGPQLAVYTRAALDPRVENPVRLITIPPEGYLLEPGVLYLGSTVERTESHGFVPTLSGKSSVGRMGLSIHVTAGQGDAGFCGHWTLELFCLRTVQTPSFDGWAPAPDPGALPGEGVLVLPEMPIGQLTWQGLSRSVGLPYGKKDSAKYADQATSPVASKMFLNWCERENRWIR